MDDKLAGEAAKLATQAGELAGNLKGMAQQITDMAVEQGGNCPLSEFGKVVEKYGVKIVGPANLPGELATDSSALFSRNLLNFITPMVDKETKALKIDLNDEVVKGTLVTQDGRIVHPSLSVSS